MAARLRQTLAFVRDRARPLAAIVFVLYGPLYALNALCVAAGWLPEEAADRLFGLIAVLIMPLVNGAVLWQVHGWREGRAMPLADALQTARRAWSRLLTVYVAVSFIMVGWLAVALLPVFLLMKVLAPAAANSGLGQTLALGAAGALAMAFLLPRYAFIDSCVVVGGVGPYEARQHSIRLSQGRRRRILAAGLLIMGIPFALESVGDLAGDFLGKSPEYGLVAPFPVVLAGLCGFVASMLYVVPTAYFYLLYRDIGGLNEDAHRE